jgi:hypothetical protein
LSGEVGRASDASPTDEVVVIVSSRYPSHFVHRGLDRDVAHDLAPGLGHLDDTVHCLCLCVCRDCRRHSPLVSRYLRDHLGLFLAMGTFVVGLEAQGVVKLNLAY